MAVINFPEFDRDRLRLYPLADRQHDLSRNVIFPLAPSSDIPDPYPSIAKKIVQANELGVSVVLMMGAHVLRAGVQRYLIDLMERGLLSCIAMNGAGVIHDYEFALAGATTESVARYIQDGRFGLWQETGRINDIVSDAAACGLGLGEAVGKVIEEEHFPGRDTSILAAAYRFGIPLTVHVGIGYDITHEHPNFNGAAYGATSYKEFLRFASVLEKLENGVVMNFGSAVMGPEVFLKALAMVRNVAAQEGRKVANFTTLVCDLAELPPKYVQEPCKSNPQYYFRPWKTMLVRTVNDGGESFYIQGNHADTIPYLWNSILNETKE